MIRRIINEKQTEISWCVNIEIKKEKK